MDKEYLFPQDRIGGLGDPKTIREGGATILDFYAFAFIVSGDDTETAFENAHEALKQREKLNG